MDTITDVGMTLSALAESEHLVPADLSEAGERVGRAHAHPQWDAMVQSLRERLRGCRAASLVAMAGTRGLDLTGWPRDRVTGWLVDLDSESAAEWREQLIERIARLEALWVIETAARG